MKAFIITATIVALALTIAAIVVYKNSVKRGIEQSNNQE